MTRKPSSAASKKRESEQRKERELFSWRSPFPLGGESERTSFAFFTLVSRKHTDAVVRFASSGSQFVEPAVYAPQNPGIQLASSTIHCQAASLACLTVIVGLSLLMDTDMRYSPLLIYSSIFDIKHSFGGSAWRKMAHCDARLFNWTRAEDSFASLVRRNVRSRQRASTSRRMNAG